MYIKIIEVFNKKNYICLFSLLVCLICIYYFVFYDFNLIYDCLLNECYKNKLICMFFKKIKIVENVEVVLLEMWWCLFYL